MSLLKFKFDNKVFGIVRNQKCATTSIMSYIAQALWNADPKEQQSYRTFQLNAPGVYIRDNLYENYADELSTCDVRIAVWRDPVDKFTSGFTHTMYSPTGAQDNLWIGKPGLDEFLANYDYYMTNPNVNDHCATNTARLGDRKEAYTHIFEHTDADAIADMLGCAGTIRHRVALSNYKLSDDNRNTIAKLMADDYAYGWSG
mgnify:FL=1|jgi:hypothetical protein